MALDATASIGLEKGHYLSDIAAFSSCKGLFGLTGACFVAFNKYPKKNINQLNLNLFNHLEKKMTGNEFYNSTPDQISNYQKPLAGLKKTISETESIWLNLHAIFEADAD